MHLHVFTGTPLLFVASLVAYGAALSLGSGSATQGNAVSLPVTLSTSGAQVAAVGWQVAYSTQDFSNISASLGTSGSAASKTVQWAATSAGQYSCVLSGVNQNVLGDGAVATVTLTVSNSSSAVSLSALGSAPESWMVPLSTTGGVVTISSRRRAPIVTAVRPI